MALNGSHNFSSNAPKRDPGDDYPDALLGRKAPDNRLDKDHDGYFRET